MVTIVRVTAVWAKTFMAVGSVRIFAVIAAVIPAAMMMRFFDFAAGSRYQQAKPHQRNNCFHTDSQEETSILRRIWTSGVKPGMGNPTDSYWSFAGSCTTKP